MFTKLLKFSKHTPNSFAERRKKHTQTKYPIFLKILDNKINPI